MIGVHWRRFESGNFRSRNPQGAICRNRRHRDTLGWVYYKKGIYDSSVDMFQEALKLGKKNNRPEGAAFHYHLGLAYQKTGKAALARREWEQALKVDPKFQDAGEVKQLLAELKSGGSGKARTSAVPSKAE